MIKLTDIEEKEFAKLAEGIISHPDYLYMKKLKAHGRLTVYDHSIDVARCAFKMNRRLKMNSNEKELITGALLHDFYLYDWHKAKILHVPLLKLHGYTHPFKAYENASERFELDDKEKNIIQSHMWPLTLRTVPNSLEAWIVCMCDKIVATKESFVR